MFRISYTTLFLCFIVAAATSCEAEDPFDLYVIIHGRRISFPDWPTDLMKTLNATQDPPETAARLALAMLPFDGDDLGSFSKGPKQGNVYSRFLLYDWSERNIFSTTPVELEVTAPLTTAISERIIAHGRDKGRPMNIHFISHSQGCYVASTVMDQLKKGALKQKTGFVLWTALDPSSLWDKKLSLSNDSLFDWQMTFIQLNQGYPFNGEPIKNGITYDISTTLQTWENQDSNLKANHHSLVHYWYTWLYNDGSLNTFEYSDPVNQHIQTQMNTELRQLLYAENTIVENFEGGAPRAFELHGNAKIADKYVDLTRAEEWKVGSMWSRNPIMGDFSVDFTFVMDNQRQGGSIGGADGFTITLAPSNQFEGEGLGGSLGLEGIENSVSVAFDTYYNREHYDSRNPWNYVSLRRNGSPRTISLPGRSALLPERSDSGNLFMVRVACIKDEARIRVYSFGQDRSMEITLPLDPVWKKQIKHGAYVAFTSATATGYQSHKIIGPIIAGPAVMP